MKVDWVDAKCGMQVEEEERLLSTGSSYWDERKREVDGGLDGCG